ncbi:interleukin-34 [Spea bombifrons]|uniref:interleukin-34 n=1 Tax=Spea bombifrons TaxID=233779 RepID=UPI00234A4C24|nr:interleukin-34 [Spea bombifrons]
MWKRTMWTAAVGLFYTLALARAALVPNECQITKALNGKLLYDKRLMYMSDYFPLDYKLFVKHEEVLRFQNITSLMNQGIPVKELRYLWGIINERVLVRMKAVLPGRHPTFSYITELLAIFKELLQIQQEADNEIVLRIMKRLRLPQELTSQKPVRPKALMDNCFRVLFALYEEECGLCNPRSEPFEDP